MFPEMITPATSRVPLPYCKFFTDVIDLPAADGGRTPTDVDFVTITLPGQRDGPTHRVSEWLETMKHNVRQRPNDYPPQLLDGYKAAYEAWKRKEAPPISGIPIKSWPALTPSQIKRCVDANVLSVEDLRDANAEALAAIGMDAQTLQNMARAYFTEMGSSGAILKKMADLEARLVMSEERAANAVKRAEDAERELSRDDEAPRRAHRKKAD